jgi:hypothetical protein
MKWDFNDGQVTGTTTFNVDKEGSGSLVYMANDGHVLYGTVAPGSYQKLTDGSAIFSGTITAGSSPDYLANPTGNNSFTPRTSQGAPVRIGDEATAGTPEPRDDRTNGRLSQSFVVTPGGRSGSGRPRSPAPRSMGSA